MEKDCILNATRSIALRAASRPEPPTSWDFERPITTTAAVAAAAAAAAPASAAATADATAASVAFYLDATAASRAAPVPPAPRPQGGVRATFGGWRARQTAPRSPPLARRAPRPLRLAAGDAGGGATAAAGWGQRGATRRARCGAHRHPQRRQARPPTPGRRPTRAAAASASRRDQEAPPPPPPPPSPRATAAAVAAASPAPASRTAPSASPNAATATATTALAGTPPPPPLAPHPPLRHRVARRPYRRRPAARG
ncbi:hypothetical protein BU14_0068s0005 [Porphyra umbilicalis]|uniref:Uncharacterized protein n=1 Tax=Porphyra umbilicalis TaxID=2786 RepID=A0A1X6PGC8_PORUM|nr:hypothetical protein BU14_0068s0005 [Porphyra umbilicalis]|eukprot:OSX79909.1 hypothetical protein BU14_0068s0005 [Porphyra umbilicalis]